MSERFSWGVQVELVPTSREVPCAARIAHDAAGAPYVVDATGSEIKDTLVSFSDEGDVRACAHLTRKAGSPVVGLGVDLVDAGEFRDEERGAFLVRSLFGESEARLAQGVNGKDHPLAYAYAFGAKEAAFKATSQSLRAWRQGGGTGIFFEVRDFALAQDTVHEVGVRRAASLFDTLGIARIELEHVTYGDLVLIVAVALSPDANDATCARRLA